MRGFRLLALLMIACGLFVQSAAYAAARPAEPGSMDRHCQEMMAQQDETGAAGSKGQPCTEKRLDCLVAMNCIAPLFASDEIAPVLPAAAGEHAYAPWQASAWLGASHGPEPPPPQMRI